MNTIFGPNRRSIRLKDYDYRSPGIYYVTICVQNREHLFGHVENGQMILSAAGEMISKEWQRIPTDDGHVSIDEFIVMPNHIHGIIVIQCIESDGSSLDCHDRSMNRHGASLDCHGASLDCHGGQARGPAPTLALPDLVQRFKSWTTHQYHKVASGRLWQRNYHERIIRSEKQLNNSITYIRNNPANWESDPENTAPKKNPSGL